LILIPEEDCSRCGDPLMLYVTVGNVKLCSKCWKKAGKPWPRTPVKQYQ
jgi:hypothetical protein